MMELPEALTIARQLQTELPGRTVRFVEAGLSPHRFAFFNGDPAGYAALLQGRTVEGVQAMGGFVRIDLGEKWLLLGDGVNIRHLTPGAKLPAKYQMRVEWDDGSNLICSIQMYGGMWVHDAGDCHNPYYLVAVKKPSPLEDGFDQDYFLRMAAEAKQSLSVKAFLATEQRIPGLGNGVLQDLLFDAKLHPKTSLERLDEKRRLALHGQVRRRLAEITELGGRDTEKDVYGQPGGYHCRLTAKAAGTPCPVCGDTIQKQAYLGGNIYFCPSCQPLEK